MDTQTHDDPVDDMSADVPARIRIEPDRDPQNPRADFDHVGVIVHWHKRYTFHDRAATTFELEILRRGGFPLLKRYLRRFEDMAILLPLGLLDHSGIHLYVGGGAHWSDSAGWDSGTVGFITCTRTQVRDEWNGDLAAAEQRLIGEVEAYDDYLTGNINGFVIENWNGDVLDSCWGFRGHDWRTNGMAAHWDADVLALAEGGKITCDL